MFCYSVCDVIVCFTALFVMKNVSTLTILVMGKGGVGKSSTVNSIVGERVATVSAFQVMLLPGLISIEPITEVAYLGVC